MMVLLLVNSRDDPFPTPTAAIVATLSSARCTDIFKQTANSTIFTNDAMVRYDRLRKEICIVLD